MRAARRRRGLHWRGVLILPISSKRLHGHIYILRRTKDAGTVPRPTGIFHDGFTTVADNGLWQRDFWPEGEKDFFSGPSDDNNKPMGFQHPKAGGRVQIRRMESSNVSNRPQTNSSGPDIKVLHTIQMNTRAAHLGDYRGKFLRFKLGNGNRRPQGQSIPFVGKEGRPQISP